MKFFIKKLMKHVMRNIDSIIELIKYFSLFPIAHILYSHRKIWIISERGTDARDNGFCFFVFLRTIHPNIEVYYIIDRNSVDFPKVALYGNVVQYKSLMHYLLFISSYYKISTHIMGYSPNWRFYNRFSKIYHIPGKKIFLQHGVTKDNIEGLYSDNTDLDLFICGARPEYDFVLENFRYRPNIVKYTGLARFDNLHDFAVSKQILIMPTWRVYLNSMNKEDLLKSEYFDKWNSLLNNQVLNDLLVENEIEVIFYPHYEFQKYIDSFTTNSDRIRIADLKNFDVQKLLKESMLLITDYSSVFFDFAYMKKPVLYYQFDENRFFKEHYKKGYFDYYLLGFGDVVSNQEILVEKISFMIKNDFLLSEDYAHRIDAFFELFDRNNCQRILKEIEAIK